MSQRKFTLTQNPTQNLDNKWSMINTQQKGGAGCQGSSIKGAILFALTFSISFQVGTIHFQTGPSMMHQNREITCSSSNMDSGAESCTRIVNGAEPPCESSGTLVDDSKQELLRFEKRTRNWKTDIFQRGELFNFEQLTRRGTISGPDDSKLFFFEGLASYCAFRSVPGNLQPASAWNDSMSLVSGPNLGGDGQPFDEQDPAMKDWTPVEVFGDHVVYNSWFIGNFGHILHDHLPAIAWLKERLPTHFKFLIAKNEKMEEILNSLDPDFVLNRVVWLERGRQVATVRGGKLAVFVFPVPPRSNVPMESLYRWLDFRSKSPSSEDQLSSQKNLTVVYYTRGGSKDTHHGRIVEEQHELDILHLIQSKMDEHGLSQTHRLVVYNGQENGETMSVEKQKQFFSTASVAIGPHGSGMANVLWMQPVLQKKHQAYSCDPIGNGLPYRRPQVLEFLVGDKSQVVTPFGIYMKTYNYLYAAPRRLEYWHILYAPNSTESTTYINLNYLSVALDGMWKDRPFE